MLDASGACPMHDNTRVPYMISARPRPPRRKPHRRPEHHNAVVRRPHLVDDHAVGLVLSHLAHDPRHRLINCEHRVYLHDERTPPRHAAASPWTAPVALVLPAQADLDPRGSTRDPLANQIERD